MNTHSLTLGLGFTDMYNFTVLVDHDSDHMRLTVDCQQVNNTAGNWSFIFPSDHTKLLMY